MLGITIKSEENSTGSQDHENQRHSTGAKMNIMDQNTESRDHIDLAKYYKREERGIDSVINIATNSSSEGRNSPRDKAESIVSMPENKFHSIEHTPELIPRRKKAKIRSTKVLSEKY